jgi:two-component system OmpR family sensor kinase
LLAQADAGMPLARAPVRLDTLVAECVAAVARQAPDHDVQIEMPGPVVVQGDQGRLSQLLNNLLLNAVRHTPPGTHVQVRLVQRGCVVELAVADDGPGIPAEHLPHIWDRYYRVHKAHSRAVGGTGLGLPLVKYIAEAHGGQVAVASGAAQGATFTVTLPATE